MLHQKHDESYKNVLPMKKMSWLDKYWQQKKSQPQKYLEKTSWKNELGNMKTGWDQAHFALAFRSKPIT